MVVLICLVLVIPCKAETIIVDPNGSADFNNIQDAIDYSWHGDTVLVRPGTYYENTDFHGKAIAVTSIDPNDSDVIATTIIDADNDGIVVSFHMDEDSNSVITGFTITGGHAEYGAGVCCWGESSPTIRNCVITANYANDISGSKGAGIYYVGSSTISGCTISDNSADESGGGIYCDATDVAIIDCNISNNSAYDGGGIYFQGGNQTVSYCTIRDNSASENGSGGGGIYCESSNTDISNCTINNNLADEEGGGIYCIFSDLTISDCNIIGNSADGFGSSGGAIKSRYGELTISDCNIIGNSADHYGGGIHCYESNSPTVNHCTLSNNSANRCGGGIYCMQSSPFVIDCNISSNLANWSGGALYCESSSPTISNCIINSNSAGHWGGGIHCQGGTISDCNIIGNSAVRSGGGIYCIYGSPTINNCTISGNSTTSDGGGISCEGGSPTISDCIISGNSATGAGGGISLYHSFNCHFVLYITVSDCTITGNSARVGGGGISCKSSSPNCTFHTTVSNCIISGNSASASSSGGGILCEGGSSLTVSKCIISGNSAVSNGGGIYCYDINSPIVNNCTISGNSANNIGGGIYCYDNASPTIIKNNIICNSASGSGIYSMYSDCAISYNNVYGNAAGDYEGWAWPGQGDISVDPCFAAPGYWSDPCSTPSDPNDDVWGDGDYHLKSRFGRWDPNGESWIQDDVNSLCIDAGDPNSDWSAEFWPHGKRINMGAYGGTPEASMSSQLDIGNIANLNNDAYDIVNLDDLALFVDKWCYEESPIAEDLDRSGFVNFIDFAIFANNWQLPRQASNPNPANGAIGVDLNADLSWRAGWNARSHDVYFGTVSPPPFIRNQTATIFEPGTMTPSTMYYWRIDEVNPWGTTTGTVWRFRAFGPPPYDSEVFHYSGGVHCDEH